MRRALAKAERMYRARRMDVSAEDYFTRSKTRCDAIGPIMPSIVIVLPSALRVVLDVPVPPEPRRSSRPNPAPDSSLTDRRLSAELRADHSRTPTPRRGQRMQVFTVSGRIIAPLQHEHGARSGTRLGGYEILALIGAGGMGEVYRAVDCRLKRTTAIKVLAPSVGLWALDSIHSSAKRKPSHRSIIQIS